jgi:hypothetical protein
LSTSGDLFHSAKHLFFAARNAATASRLAIVGQCLQPTQFWQRISREVIESAGAMPGPGGDGRCAIVSTEGYLRKSSRCPAATCRSVAFRGQLGCAARHTRRPGRHQRSWAHRALRSIGATRAPTEPAGKLFKRGLANPLDSPTKHPWPSLKRPHHHAGLLPTRPRRPLASFTSQTSTQSLMAPQA